jgi:hypothetical protein
LNKNNIFNRAYLKYITYPKFKKERTKTFITFLKHFGFDEIEYDNIVDEIIEDNKFNDEVNKRLADVGIGTLFPLEKISWPYFIYFLVRKNKPEKIVETGVWYGVSTSIILNAIKRNEKGFLFSIDLPAYFESGGYTDENPYLREEDRTSSLPKGKSPGFIVPEGYKDNWKLILGDSKIHLPALFVELKNADIFLHDSLHSYENMVFEFKTAMNYIKKGGYILSDNIDWHNAFFDFCKKNNLDYKTFLAYFESNKLKHNFGAIRLM